MESKIIEKKDVIEHLKKENAEVLSQKNKISDEINYVISNIKEESICLENVNIRTLYFC